MRQILIWGSLALLGLAVTVAVTVAVNNLSGQSFALAGEPLERSQTLAPPGARITSTARTAAPRKPKSRVGPKVVTRTVTVQAPPAPAPAPTPATAPGPAAPPNHDRSEQSDDRTKGDD